MTWTSSWRSLSDGDALGEVLGDERRALPGERVGERAAGDVLGDAVEQAGERDLLGSCRPVVGEDLVGPSAEEQRVHAPRLLEDDLAGLLVSSGACHPPCAKPPSTVLVGRSRRLCHPVQRHELGHDELAHVVVLFLVSMRSSCRRHHRAEVIAGGWSRASQHTHARDEVEKGRRRTTRRSSFGRR